MFRNQYRVTRGGPNLGKQEVDDSDEEEDEGPEEYERSNDYIVGDGHQIRIWVTFQDIHKAEEAMKLANTVKDDYGWRVFGHPKNKRVLKCSVGFRSHVIPAILAQLDPTKWEGTLKLKVKLPYIIRTFR